jgi:hypothetical protein
VHEKNVVPTWIRFLGFGSSIAMFTTLILYPSAWFGDKPTRESVILTIAFLWLPALGAALISLLGKLWYLLLPGLLFLFVAATVRIDQHPPTGSVVLVLGAVGLLITPFLALALGKHRETPP